MNEIKYDSIEGEVCINSSTAPVVLKPTMSLRIEMCKNPRNGGQLQQLWYDEAQKKGRWVPVEVVVVGKSSFDIGGELYCNQ